MKSLTTEQFIEKATGVHGCLFDYSMVEYKNITSPIKVLCKRCGHVTIISQARNHIESARGCDVCSNVHPRKQTTELFLKRLNYRTDKFKFYNFTQFEYKGTQSKSVVVCDSGHTYSVAPNDLLSGYGCPKCWRSRIPGRPTAPIPDKEINTLLERNIYVCEKNYKGIGKNVSAVCLICDHEWDVRFSALTSGGGCPECAKENIRKKLAIPFDEAVKRAVRLYGDHYFYVRDTYADFKSTMTIVCKKHGPFKASMAVHCRKERPCVCKECFPAKYGFNSSLPAILYYLEITPGKNRAPIYKIGITNRTVEQRYSLLKDKKKIKVLKVWEYPRGEDARKTERKIIQEHKESLYSGDPPLVWAGTSEMFCEDVLALANQGEK